MVTFTYRIQDPLGVHARPAGMLRERVSSHQSQVAAIIGEKNCVVNDGFLRLMAMSIHCGDVVIFEVTGDDEVEAAADLKMFLESVSF